MNENERCDRVEKAMRRLPTQHMTDDEIETIKAIVAAAHGRYDAEVAAKRAEWEALRTKNGGGVYRVTSTYTGRVEHEVAVAVLRCTKTLIIAVAEPRGLRDGVEFRFKAGSGRLNEKRTSVIDPRRELVLSSASDRVKAVVVAAADRKGAWMNEQWRDRVAALPAPGGEA